MTIGPGEPDSRPDRSPAPGGATAWYGVVGHPLTETLSPPLQNAALRARDLPAVYLPVPLPRDGFAETFRALVDDGLAGANVTIPFKREAADLCDELEDDAREADSVNTIRVEGRRLVGTSTDGIGFVRAAEALGWDGGSVVCLGAGGAARAVLTTLARSGLAGDVVVCARNAARASWVETAGGRLLPWDPVVWGCDPAFESASLVIQATPLGREGTRLPELPWSRLPEHVIGIDLNYGRPGSTFVGLARAHGLCAEDGRRMLVHQGAAAFEYWFGPPVPVSEMERALDLPDPPA